VHRTPTPNHPGRRQAGFTDRLFEVFFALLVLALFLLLIAFCPGVSRAAPPAPGPCDPPRTRIALLPLADGTDHAWEAWTGTAPAPFVTRLLADSLRAARGREVTVLANVDPHARRAADDGPALERARPLDPEIVITGTVIEFSHDDRRENGKFWRWGVGALELRSKARVRLVLRVLDGRDGSVIIETAATREKLGRATANVDRRGADASPLSSETLLVQALGEALSDLNHTIGLRLDARWQARVESVAAGSCALDAGRARGHFVGQRLEVWRAGIETFDEELVRVRDDVRVGALVVTAVDHDGRVRARLVEGDALPGDRVRVCSGASSRELSLRR
jgi:hypothetical protein